jgi:tetratricopeptide (TPR) repeat protein
MKDHVLSARRCARFDFRLALILACTLCGASARADSLRDTFSRGNAAYARGDYQAAISEYSTLLESGVSDVSVSHNLAAAYGSIGKYGQAIRYFERALGEAPGDDGADRGLKLARDLLGERQAKERGEAIVAERPPLSSAIFADISENALAVLLLASSTVFGATLLLLLFARAEAQRIALGIAAGAGILFALMSGFGLWAKADFGAAGARAVVISEHAPVREGPDPAARLSSELSEGESVRILANEGDFSRVKLTRGGEGYVMKSALGEI